jgi:hypothetical protein
MAGGRPPSFRSFTCPNCRALYQLVKAEAGPETVDQQVGCRVCGAPLPGREDGFVLKYFLLRKAGRPDPRAGVGSQRARPKSGY